MSETRKIEVEVTQEGRSVEGLRRVLDRLEELGAPPSARIRISGGYPGAEEYYVAEASWGVSS